ncbi:DNA polymerase III subunit alpha [Salinicoccus sp. HZC-1]|uniref:DNA polymerase III subunit alpha n=1 Tax=Salinicoccus sp. HZC-1 TaxID=3385497 RepID=UPI00398B16AE
MINLNVHSCFDFLNSNIEIDDLLKKISQDGQRFVALTDFNRMHGVYQFLQLAPKYNIKPLIGMEIKIADGLDGVPFILIAKNDRGYRELIRLSAMLSYKSITHTPLKYLTENIDECIAVAKSDAGIDVLQALKINEDDKYQSHTVDTDAFTKVYAEASHYLSAQDLPAVRVLNAIRDNARLDVYESRNQEGTAFIRRFDDLNNEERAFLEANRQLAEKCDVSLPKTENVLPPFPHEENKDSKEYLWHLLTERLSEMTDGSRKYSERLEYEYGIIIEMGYEDYFLIVQDAVNYAKNAGIYVGPGRGSSSASLVSYLLNITEIDPLKYNLLFERFLNPERVTMPDIDIDFEDTRRDEIVDYLIDKYGAMNVSHIITYGTLSAKMAARDVGRVFGFSEEELKLISSIIPDGPGVTLEKAFSTNSFRSLKETNDKYKIYADICMKIEGLPRHASTHAAGVLLSESTLTEVVPVIFSDGHTLSQWTMTEVEAAGLLKIDVLGLRNLSLIRYMVNKIQKIDSGFSLKDIPENETDVYRLLSKGMTLGIFQLESDGIRKVIQDVNPSKFLDLAAVIALYRPGPMKEIPHFIEGKENPEKVEYPHPDLEETLKETYGVIVYQEQIMLIASKIAGYSYAEADILRRAMSKKDRVTLERERSHFENGAEEKGYGKKLGQFIFDLIMEFADYGFVKSHAIAYSRISYILAYIKTKYPEIFYSVILTHHFGNDVKIKQVTDEIRQLRINILPPDINQSVWMNTSDNGIRLGLGMIRGITYRTAEAIINERKNGGFKDIYDLKTRVNAVNLNKKILRQLIVSGALDCFEENRKTMLQSLPMVDSMNAEEYSHDSFLSTLGFSVKKEYQYADEMDPLEMLEGEKEVFGFYISEHPIKLKHKEMQYIPFSLLHHSKRQGEYLLFFENIKVIRTKKGQNMAFAQVSDGYQEFEAVIFPKVYFNVHPKFSEKMLVAAGRIEERKGQKQLIIENVTSPEEFKAEYLKSARQVFIRHADKYDLSAILSNTGIPVLNFVKREEIGRIKLQDINVLISRVDRADIRILR